MSERPDITTESWVDYYSGDEDMVSVVCKVGGRTMIRGHFTLDEWDWFRDATGIGADK